MTTTAPVHVISAQPVFALIYARTKPAVPTICLLHIVLIQRFVKSAMEASSKLVAAIHASSAVMVRATIRQHKDVVTVQ